MSVASSHTRIRDPLVQRAQPAERQLAAGVLAATVQLRARTMKQPGLYVAEGSQHEPVELVPVQAGDVNVDQARQPVAVIEIVMEQDRVLGSCAGPGCVRPPLAESLRVRHLAEPVACSPSG